jgi:symplekin
MDMVMDEEAKSAVAAVDAAGTGLTNFQLIDLKFPPPKEFSEEDRDLLIRASVSRIWNGVDELNSTTELGSTLSAVDMWMLLVVRLVTRVVEPPPSEEEEQEIRKSEKAEEAATGMVEVNFYSHQDRLRQTLCDYIVQDFHSR